jgi:DNA-binding MarR family transcriptional regulator
MLASTTELTNHAYAYILCPMETLSRRRKLEVAQTCVHANLKRTMRQVTQHFDRALLPSGLHVTQFTLLITCSLVGIASINDLAEKLSLDQTTLSRNLQVLQRDALIEVVSSSSDARVRLVQVTARGETVLARAYPAWRKAQEEVNTDLSPEEYHQFLNFLSRLHVTD